MAEWLKAAVLKTVMDREVHLEFESLPLRGSTRFALSPQVCGEMSECELSFEIEFFVRSEPP